MGDHPGCRAFCANFHAQHDAVLALASAADEPENALESAIIKRWRISDRITTTTAATDTGKRAKAAVAIPFDTGHVS